MIKFFLISNMYPTKKSPGYGIFVKNISHALGLHGVKNSNSALIRGKSNSKIKKIFKYLSFYTQILLKYWTKYDFIYIHFPNQALPLLYPLLKIKRKKLIVNLHGEDLMYENSGYSRILGKLMEKTCRLYASSIVVPSSYFRDVVIKRGIAAKERIIISPSGGIDELVFTPKKHLAESKESLHIGYVGRLERDKGIIEYLETCRNLKNCGITFTGVIIGYGSEYTITKRFLLDNKLSEQIELIQGISQKELGKYYQKMDLLIFSSSRAGESLGLTGIEAMACGTPVIGSDIGGIATYVKPGYNGWLTPVHDVNAILLAVKEYVAMTEYEKTKIITNCISTGKEYYSSRVSEELARSITKVISN